ncbi:MAG TPA: metalloregulator ArsR/SmtB family transcription factor [Candidatus Angelobacter sp.]|nr:metalloregulator ArsR/SmtB family transcription factor [Candidatus Angelobacter sp.]
MSDQLSNTFAALADPTRRAILARLASGEASVTELAKPFAMSMPAISKHLKVLERAGLIAHGREAQWRPRRLEPTALKEVHDWVEHYRQFWEQSLDRLDEYLIKLKHDQLKNEDLKGNASTSDGPPPHGSKKEKVDKEKKHVRNQRTK